MNMYSILCGLILLTLGTVATSKPQISALPAGARCANVWDEGCVNGQLQGAGRDDDFVNGNFNPGKRCVNVWDEGCVTGQLPGAGRDDDFVNGGLTPGKRCAGAGRGCDAGRDGDFVNGNFNPLPTNKLGDYLAARLSYLRLAELLARRRRAQRATPDK